MRESYKVISVPKVDRSVMIILFIMKDQGQGDRSRKVAYLYSLYIINYLAQTALYWAFSQGIESSSDLRLVWLINRLIYIKFTCLVIE